jgi:hypothetical protein
MITHVIGGRLYGKYSEKGVLGTTDSVSESWSAARKLSLHRDDSRLHIQVIRDSRANSAMQTSTRQSWNALAFSIILQLAAALSCISAAVPAR